MWGIVRMIAWKGLLRQKGMSEERRERDSLTGRREVDPRIDKRLVGTEIVTLGRNWRQRGCHTDKSDEGDKTEDSKRSREEEGIEEGEEKLRKKFKKKSPSERSKVKGKVDLESLENLIKGFREKTNQSLKWMQR